MDEPERGSIGTGLGSTGSTRKLRRRWLRVVEAPEPPTAEPPSPSPSPTVGDPRTGDGDRIAAAWRRGLAEIGPRPEPLIRPWPRSAMFVPVVVLAAILPGLYALRHWDLTPPGPWWGLRGLEVLEGRLIDQTAGSSGALGASTLSEAEARAYQEVALQPPLYAWLEAAGLAIGPGRDPIATVLPSYLAGVLCVGLVYLLGRSWGGPSTGLLAALLTGFNRELLVQMQQATPTTLGLLGALVALAAYERACRREGAASIRLGLLGGLGLGASLMAVGPFGLWLAAVVALQRALPGHGRGRRSGLPGLGAAGIGLAAGLAIAAPWYAYLFSRHGWEFVDALLTPPHSGGPSPVGLLDRLALLAPASLAPGVLGAWRASRRLLRGGGTASAARERRSASGSALWLAWLATSLLAVAALPRGPKPVLNLFLLVPLNLLAAGALADLACRRTSAKALAWLVPTTLAALTWWASPAIRAGTRAVLAGHRLGAGELFGLELGLMIAAALALATVGLAGWVGRREGRRRAGLAAYLAVVGFVTCFGGIREVRFRHRETGDLLMLREAIVRRDRLAPFEVLAVVGPPGGPHPKAPTMAGGPTPMPGGRLRFLLRTALPRLTWIDLEEPGGGLDALPEGHRLVILAGSEARLSYQSQARLGLEAIHPGRSGILEAYATAIEAEAVAEDDRPGPRR